MGHPDGPLSSDGRSSTGWWAAAIVLIGTTLAVAVVALSWGRASSKVAAAFDVSNVLELGAFLVFVLLGALLVLRRPHHPIGWLLAALGVAVLVQQAAQAYAVRSLATAGTGMPGGAVASWVLLWMIVPPLVLLAEVLLLFPTGRPPSRRWLPFAWAVAVGGVVLTIGWAAAAWPPRGFPLVTGGARLPFVLDVLRGALIACLPIAAVSLVVRYRHAGHEERQQLKWLLLAVVGVLVTSVAGLVTGALGRSSPVVDTLGVASVAGIAVAMTAAVLRYRLYEIDQVLSRTVSYSLLSVLLTALYAATVVVVGTLLTPLSVDSSPAVAVSTLVVAGAFTPLRTRLQEGVDRRFNRSLHDRRLAVAAFHARLRADGRLGPLEADLLAVVQDTMQPATVSVWLTSPADRGGWKPSKVDQETRDDLDKGAFPP